MTAETRERPVGTDDAPRPTGKITYLQYSPIIRTGAIARYYRTDWQRIIAMRGRPMNWNHDRDLYDEDEQDITSLGAAALMFIFWASLAAGVVWLIGALP